MTSIDVFLLYIFVSLQSQLDTVVEGQDQGALFEASWLRSIPGYHTTDKLDNLNQAHEKPTCKIEIMLVPIPQTVSPQYCHKD